MTTRRRIDELSDDEDLQLERRHLSGDQVVMGSNGRAEVVRRTASPKRAASPRRTLYEEEEDIVKNDKSLLSTRRHGDTYGVKITPLSRKVEEVKEDLSNQLLNMGFIIQDFVVTDGKVFLILAQNKAGDYVAVRPDVHTGTVYVNEGKKVVVEEVDATIIPSTTITSLAQCAGNAACGALATCNGNYCMINSQNDGTVKHHTFTVKKEMPLGSTLEIANTAIGVPLVTLSELKANPTMVDAIVRKATLTFNKEFADTTKTQLTSMINESKAVTAQLETLKNSVDSIVMSSDRKTKELLRTQETLEAVGNKTEDVQLKLKTTRDELNKIGLETFKEKEVLTELINKHSTRLGSLMKEITDTKNELFLTEVAKGNRTAERFGLPKKLDTLSLEEIKAATTDVRAPSSIKELSRVVTVTKVNTV
jgi:hypothetical protein